jgi:Zn-dependent peptidase ImmA (M78 family)/O-acetyl-ADP-ribose deacetylase (regulator of RNase III)
MTRRMPSVEEIRWTNPSVHALAGEGGPVESILGRVRHQVFAAMERGWSGPPYDPLELAELSGVEVIPIEEVEDARLVHHKGRPRIEFNANRSPERVRFSVAHELGHLAFPDAAEKIRYRTHSVGAEADAWQIELLCNLAAAELLMPTGSFPELADEITLEHLIHLGSEFFVSVEAVVLRAVRLASQPACVFAAARVDEGHRFRLDYLGGSRSWEPTIETSAITGAEALMRCSAVGSTAKEEIGGGEELLRLECVGAPPYPHTRYPRVVGLIRSPARQARGPAITYLHGDAAAPQGPEEKVITHIVNDKTATWGGQGFAPRLRERHPGLQESFREWAETEGLVLGRIHLHQVDAGIWVCTMVAQHGYGPRAAKIPLRYGALEECLRSLRTHLKGRGASIHMPKIGAGQAGGNWNVIAEMIARQLLDVAAVVNVYLPPGAEVPQAAPRQLGLHI